MQGGGASNASCTPTSLTCRTAGPWSPRLPRSPGLSAGPNTARHTSSQQRTGSGRRSFVCLRCSWRLASCWWCRRSPLRSWRSGNRPGKKQSVSSGCRETLGLRGDRKNIHGSAKGQSQSEEDQSIHDSDFSFSPGLKETVWLLKWIKSFWARPWKVFWLKKSRQGTVCSETSCQRILNRNLPN